MADAAAAAQAAKAKGNAAMSAGKWDEAISAFTEVRRRAVARSGRARALRCCCAASARARHVALPRPPPPPPAAAAVSPRLARRPLR